MMSTTLPERLEPGQPWPLGASWNGLGVNFALFSRHATRMQLCLFDSEGRKELVRYDMPERTDEMIDGLTQYLQKHQVE